MTVSQPADAAPLSPPDVADCIGCHPRDGGSSSVPRLACRDAAEITAAMTAFRAGTRAATVMDRIAKGFSDDEVAAIAAWYAAQK